MRRYEIMLILPPDADDGIVRTVTDRIASVLSERGGEVIKVDQWGKRKLAHEIKRFSEGHYIVVECSCRPEAVQELDRVLLLADDVIRFKTVVRAA